MADDDNYGAAPPAPSTPVIPDHLLPEDLKQRGEKSGAAIGDHREPSDPSSTVSLVNQEGAAGDMQIVYKQWDHLNKQSLALQENLTQVCPEERGGTAGGPDFPARICPGKRL